MCFDVLTTGKAVWFLLMISCQVCKYMLKQKSLFATLKKSPYLCSAKPERNAGLESLADIRSKSFFQRVVNGDLV